MNEYNQILDPNNAWINGEPTEIGQRYRTAIELGEGEVGYEEKTLTLEQAPTIFDLTNVNVESPNAQLGAGGIWWLPTNEQFTLSANVALPDSEMMIIIERVVNGSDVINDIRTKAVIANGVVTINASFSESGNYQITAERLNQGLEVIDAEFRLAFDKVEFDAHV